MFVLELTQRSRVFQHNRLEWYPEHEIYVELEVSATAQRTRVAQLPFPSSVLRRTALNCNFSAAADIRNDLVDSDLDCLWHWYVCSGFRRVILCYGVRSSQSTHSTG